MTWTAEQVVILRKFIADGASAQTAANDLGMSRSACIGKAHRLGLNFGSQKQPKKADRQPPRRYTPGVTVARPAIAPLAPIVIPEPLPADPVADTFDPTPFLETRAGQCRWFLEPHSHTALVCGRVTQNGSSYCAEHHARCYSKARTEESRAKRAVKKSRLSGLHFERAE